MGEPGFQVSVSDYCSSIEDWRRAQRAQASELPQLDAEQKDFARRFGIKEEEYARSQLAISYGKETLKRRAERLGELVQKSILDKLESGHQVIAVIAEMTKNRWSVRIQAPGEVVHAHLDRELVDDLLDSFSMEEMRKLRARVLSALGRDEGREAS